MKICSGFLHILDMDGRRNMITLKEEFLELLVAHAPQNKLILENIKQNTSDIIMRFSKFYQYGLGKNERWYRRVESVQGSVSVV
jgi:hypothetical protein